MCLISALGISGPGGDDNSFISHIPFSWRISHIFLCLTGVNNVYFITSLPRPVRLASLIYHAAWLCLSTPLIFLYIYSANWEKSATNLVQQASVIIMNSCIPSLGTIFMVNALKQNRTTKFLRIWNLLCSKNAIRYEGGIVTKCKRVRTVLLLSTILQCTLYLALMVQSFLNLDLAAIGSSFLHSLDVSPEVLKVLNVIYIVTISFSAFNNTLITFHFALVTITLAEEFHKLHRVICKLASPSCISGGDVWEQVRFHHKALVSLVRLHRRLFTMMLGPILIGYMMYLCFSFYFILAAHVRVNDVGNIIFAIAMLWAIIAPSNLLENQVRRIYIP